MKFEIKGDEEEKVVTFELKKDDNGDMNILANGMVVAWFYPSGVMGINIQGGEPTYGLPVDNEGRIIIKGYTRDE